MMKKETFNPVEFYDSYVSEVISRPGYPARAAYKSALLFEMYGKTIMRDIGAVRLYADIGGCFGFGANSMKFHVSRYQEKAPRTFVIEFSPGFTRIGKIIFPDIEFINTDLREWNGEVECFDLITLFDVVEHVVDPESFLKHVSKKGRYVILKTPMETTGEWRGSKPPVMQGAEHGDGHINFFSPKSYENLLKVSKLEILESHLIPTIVPKCAKKILTPEETDPPALLDELSKRPKQFIARVIGAMPGIPWKVKRKILGGGDHICLCKSQAL